MMPALNVERGSKLGDVTDLLRRVREDDRSAMDAVFALVYADLRRMAQRRLAHDAPVTLLDATSLVHEAYLRLRQVEHIDFANRAVFMAYASRVLRSVIVDFARKRLAQRRGREAVHMTLTSEAVDDIGADDTDIVRVDEALQALADTDPRLRSVVEMRYFGGLSEQEIADALDVTERTVRRDWQRARLLLSVSLQC
jgi:RNA polymerase sigma factor (TIGR02999 family)